MCITAPEGDGTQDAKAALANVDVLIQIIKEEQHLKDVKNVILLTDNTGTYSANVFHVACFDVVKSHGLNLDGIIHNEAQDGKTELDSTFFHFKFHLRKYIRCYKTNVLTPSDMAKAMLHENGLKNLDLILYC